MRLELLILTDSALSLEKGFLVLEEKQEALQKRNYALSKGLRYFLYSIILLKRKKV